MKITTLPYWGQIIGLVSQTSADKVKAARSLFITRQQGSDATDSALLYILDNDNDQFRLSSLPLPCPMHAMLAVPYANIHESRQNVAETQSTAAADSAQCKSKKSAANAQFHSDAIILVGENGHLYQTTWHAKEISQISQVSLLGSLKDQDSSTVSALIWQSQADSSASIKPSFNMVNAVSMAALKQAIVVLYPQHIVIWPYKGSAKAADSMFVTNPLILPYSPLNPSDTASDNHSANYGDNTNVNNTRMTACASSSDGQWLVVGDKEGTVSSYQWLISDAADQGVLSISSQKQLHQGRVTALTFEPAGQYFFSAGADKQLFRTHVQGDLQPLDRAKASAHSQMISAIAVSSSRLFTAADDQTIKSWPFDKGQPTTCADDLVKMRRLALSNYQDQPAVLVQGSDQSLRFVLLESGEASKSDGKLLGVAHIIKDGYQRLKDLLTDSTAHSEAAFQEGLALLNARTDSQTLDLVSGLLTDKSRKISAAHAEQLIEWVASTTLPKSSVVLEKQLSAEHSSKLRLIAFNALAIRASSSDRPLHYLQLAIKSRFEEVIAAALQGYVRYASQDAESLPNSQSSKRQLVLPIVEWALEHNIRRIRKQALASLEALLPKDSPRADLMALDSSYSDIVQAGLIRLYQRGMLSHPEVTRQVTLLQSHSDEEVRQTAFYVSILSQPLLSDALKQQAAIQGDGQLTRTLEDFSEFRLLRGTLLDVEALQAQPLTDNFSQLTTLKLDTTQLDALPSNADSQITAKVADNGDTAQDELHLSINTQDFVSQGTDIRASDKVDTTGTKRQNKKSGKNEDKLKDTVLTQLSNEHLEPLLQGLGNSYADISFRAAYALACLQDVRALGTLIRLMHADEAAIRAGVATAMGNLYLAAATTTKSVLPSLLDDQDAGVRQVAWRSYGKLESNVLLWSSAGFASSQQDIHEQALALFLTQALPKTDAGQSVPDSEDMTTVLLQALNNPFTSIRQEVVKVLLNRLLAQEGAANIVDTIELLQKSLFEDVHQVALEEWQRTLLQLKSSTKAPSQAQLASQRATYQAVLALFFADSFTAIRQQAFDIALKQRKQLGLTEIIKAALISPFSDTRAKALTTLSKQAGRDEMRTLLPALVALFNDDSLDLRQQALKVALRVFGFATADLSTFALVKAEGVSEGLEGQSDKPSDYPSGSTSGIDAIINSALASPYPDIQLTVAQLLADLSHTHYHRVSADEQSISLRYADQAYAVFERYLLAPMPTSNQSSEAFNLWHEHVAAALTGLVQLPEPVRVGAIDWFDQYLHHSDADFSELAPYLLWLVGTNQSKLGFETVSTKTIKPETTCYQLDDHAAKLLIDWQQDERAIVSQSASLALAIWGDEHGQHFFASAANSKSKHHGQSDNLNKLAAPLSITEWLQARHGLSITHAAQLRSVFKQESFAPAARLLLVFYDLMGPAKTPKRLIEALSFADNETAVLYAHILARYAPSVSQDKDGQDGDARNKGAPWQQPIWHYMSSYLTRQLNHLLSSHAATIDPMLSEIAAPSVVTDPVVASLPVNQEVEPLDSVKADTMTVKVDKSTLRDSVLTSLSANQLQSLATLCWHINPLVRAQAVAVLCDLSKLLSFYAYSNSSAVAAALQQWQRRQQALFDTYPLDVTTLNDFALNDQINPSAGDYNVSDYDSNTDSNTGYNTAAHGDANIYPYQSLAFGAWLGVIREGDDYYGQSSTTEQAIRGLLWLAQTDHQSIIEAGHNEQGWQDSVTRVLLPLLNHDHYDSRKLAWDGLKSLNTPSHLLADQAINTSYQDMVERGLQLLISDLETNDAISSKLIPLLQTNSSVLAQEVYKVLKRQLGALSASLLGMEAYYLPLRQQIINEWQQVTPASNSEVSQAAIYADKIVVLTKALHNDDRETRLASLTQLASDFIDRQRLGNELTAADATIKDSPSADISISDILNGLLALWRSAQMSYEQSHILDWITTALDNLTKLCKKLNETHDELSAQAAQLLHHFNHQILSLLDTPERQGQVDEIYRAIGNLRDVSIVPTLLDRLEQHYQSNALKMGKNVLQQHINCLITISGFDQPIEDYLVDSEEEIADKRWLEHQYPRHPQVLLALFNTLLSHSDYGNAARLLRSLAWVSPAITDVDNINQAIDDALLLAYQQMPANHTQELVEAMAYRADKRSGKLNGLQQALTHKDTNVQFIAAEGLAKRGHFEGLSILLATIDYHNDSEMRRRSVLALGELVGNALSPRMLATGKAKSTKGVPQAAQNQQLRTLYKAYDKLIKLAEDYEHYLQDVASEALGHLAQGGEFEFSAHIFELLKARLEAACAPDSPMSPWNPAIVHWLSGLRWLGTRAAWEQIRHYLRQQLQNEMMCAPMQHGISLLQYSDSDANKQLLLDILTQQTLDDEDVVLTAFATAQKLWGNDDDTIYPYDWAVLKGRRRYLLDETDQLSIERITNHASLKQLTDFMSQYAAQLGSAVMTSLTEAVLSRDDITGPELLALLNESNPFMQQLALNYLTQHPDKLNGDLISTDKLSTDKPDISNKGNAIITQLLELFVTIKAQWQATIHKVANSPALLTDAHWLGQLQQLSASVRPLIWLLVRSAAHQTSALTDLVYWLLQQSQLSIVQSHQNLARIVNAWWQQLLLALLASDSFSSQVPHHQDIQGQASNQALSPSLDASVLMPLAGLDAGGELSPLSYDNQALLKQVLTHLKQAPGDNKHGEQAGLIKGDISHNNSLVPVSHEHSINQQILAWMKAGNSEALHQWATDDTLSRQTRVRAIEGLGQLHEPQIATWLEQLMSSESDSELKTLAYKVLRRWQRAMSRTEKKRPLPFAGVDLPISQAATAPASAQRDGDK
ncbi:MAG: hypothetical protein Q4P13_00330 [Psychrobacter sp.]|nr:hypothetical protein [Psychrobacter sp.]